LEEVRKALLQARKNEQVKEMRVKTWLAFNFMVFQIFHCHFT